MAVLSKKRNGGKGEEGGTVQKGAWHKSQSLELIPTMELFMNFYFWNIYTAKKTIVKIKFKIIIKKTMGSPWQIAMGTGWESEGQGFEPGQLPASFDPGLPKI